MAGSTRAFAVARRAQLASGCSANAVFAHEVTFVEHVARRACKLFGQIDMAALAIGCLPLVLVRVTREALGHRRTEGRLLRLAHGGVTWNALTAELRNVLGMGEAQMLPRQTALLTRVALAMASHAGPRIVRLRMTTDAGRGLRQMQWPLVLGAGDAFMTAHTRDPRERMCPMLERTLRIARTDTEQPRACGEADRKNEQAEAKERPHRGLAPELERPGVRSKA
jgi:hypothetical protein